MKKCFIAERISRPFKSNLSPLGRKLIREKNADVCGRSNISALEAETFGATSRLEFFWILFRASIKIVLFSLVCRNLGKRVGKAAIRSEKFYWFVIFIQQQRKFSSSSARSHRNSGWSSEIKISTWNLFYYFSIVQRSQVWQLNLVWFGWYLERIEGSHSGYSEIIIKF